MATILGTADLIDRVLTDHDMVSIANPKQRAKALRNIDRAVQKIWHHRNWHFRYANGSHTVTAGSFTIADFVSFGPGGGLFVPGQAQPLRWITQRDYARLVAADPPGVPSRTPLRYTELSILENETLIGVYPIYSGAVTSFYQRTSPDIADDNPGGLDIFPAQWIGSTLYEWTVYEQMKDKANIQSLNEQMRVAEESLKQMVRECRGGRADSHRIVPYGVQRRFS